MGLLSSLLSVISLVIFLFADIFSDEKKHAVTGIDLLTEKSFSLEHQIVPWLVVVGTIGCLLLNLIFSRSHSSLKRFIRIVFAGLPCIFFGLCLTNTELIMTNYQLVAGGFWLSCLITVLNVLLACIMFTLPTDNYMQELKLDEDE